MSEKKRIPQKWARLDVKCAEDENGVCLLHATKRVALCGADTGFSRDTIQRVGKVSRSDRRYGGTIERSELNRKRRIKKVGRVRKFKRSRKYEESGEVEGRKMMSQVTRTGGKSEGRGGTGGRDGKLPRGN